MKTAIYIRVSTKGQDTEMQRKDLIRYCEYHGLEYDIFEEKLSGRTTERPELKRMMSLVKECHYNKVLVWKIDRFARSVKDLSNLVYDLEHAKCAFISFKDQVDLSTPIGKAMFQLLGVFAELELNTMKSRQLAGIAVARSKGVKFGRPKCSLLPLQVEIEVKKKGSVSGAAKALGISRAKAYALLKKAT